MGTCSERADYIRGKAARAKGQISAEFTWLVMTFTRAHIKAR